MPQLAYVETLQKTSKLPGILKILIMFIPSYRHIVLADDDRDDIELFQSAVKECSSNIKVSAAEDGQMLIELLEKDSVPDFIVLDLNMPRMSGYDCLRVIRKNSRYNNVPVIMFSTSSSPKDMDDCFKNGANDYIVKPSDLNNFRLVVNEICNGKKLEGNYKGR